MTRDDYLWVAVKVVALWLLLQMALAVPLAGTNMMTLITTGTVLFRDKASISSGDEIDRSFAMRVLASLVGNLLLIAFYGGLGLLLIRKNERVLSFLKHNPAGSGERAFPVGASALTPDQPASGEATSPHDRPADATKL